MAKPCAPVTFPNIDRRKFLAIRARIRAQANVETVGDQGTATGNGVTIQWTYKEPTQTLVLQCTDKPWLIREEFIASKIRSFVESASV